MPVLTALVLLATCQEAAPAARDRTVRHAGQEVHYRDAGKGPEALVLVHGWGCDARVWRHQVPALATRARVLAVDLPGHGRSGVPAEGCTMALFTGAIRAVMDDAGVKRAVLVGHSNGAPVALSFARAYPQRTLALVSVDGWLLNIAPTPEAAEAMIAPLRGEGYRAAALQSVRPSLTPGLDEADRELVLQMLDATPQDVLVSSFLAVVDPAAWSDDGIDLPLLTIYASSWFSADYKRSLLELAPMLDEETLEAGVGHFLMMERPEAFRALVEGFLDENELFSVPAPR